MKRSFFDLVDQLLSLGLKSMVSAGCFVIVVPVLIIICVIMYSCTSAVVEINERHNNEIGGY